MVGRLIAGLVWLTYVQSDQAKDIGMNENAEKMPMTMMQEREDSSISMGELSSMKTKRYLSHHHSSPCPPFYPHIGMHMPMWDMKPYGPPAYPKNDVHPAPAMYNHHQPQQHNPQYVHQPTYTSYVPKQTIQYVKPEIKGPIYQPIHHVQPSVIKQHMPNYYHHYQQPMLENKISYAKQPIFAYAPTYHKPMPMIWPAMQINNHDYNNHQQPTIVYKPEQPKCAPCPSLNQIHQPTLSHVKIVQPPVHQVKQSGFYIPVPVHQPIVKPCAK